MFLHSWNRTLLGEDMKKPEVMSRLRVFMQPLYAAIQKEIEIPWPCPDCDNRIVRPGYLYLKMAFCPKCGRLMLIGATDGYDWVR